MGGENLPHRIGGITGLERKGLRNEQSIIFLNRSQHYFVVELAGGKGRIRIRPCPRRGFVFGGGLPGLFEPFSHPLADVSFSLGVKIRPRRKLVQQRRSHKAGDAAHRRRGKARTPHKRLMPRPA